jgi:thioredoxin 1
MKKQFYLFLFVGTMLLNACSNVSGSIDSNTETSNGNNTTLSAQQFSDKIKQTPDAVVLDVRTAEEFAKGHLPNAKNIDIHDKGFISQVKRINTSNPVLVYCLSGARSAAAAVRMRSEGFTNVYELDGGIIKWRVAGLPEVTDNVTASIGMNMEQYHAIFNTNKLVLIDFYADWCGPCKLMAPYIEEIKTSMNDKVQVVRINADDNQKLLKSLGIDALPTLIVYKNKQESWRNVGYIEKDKIVAHLR